MAAFETIKTENFVATIARVRGQKLARVNFWARHEYEAWQEDTRLPVKAFKMERVMSRGARPDAHKELARLERMIGAACKAG